MKNLILSLVLISIVCNISAQSIRVTATGKGEPMLFFPHIGCSSSMWDEIVDHYAVQYTCYKFDFAGFAGMPAIEGDYTNAYVKAVSEFIEQKKLSNVILVGQNYGAFVAVKVALANAGNVKKIIASDFYPALKMVLDTAMTEEKLTMIKESVRKSIIGIEDEKFRANQKMVAEGMNFLDTTRVAIFLDWQMASDRKTLAETLCEQLTEDLRPALKSNGIPLLAISTWYFAKTYRNMPESDAPKALDAMFAGATNVEHALTSETKDFIHMDKPSWYLDVTESFLTNGKSKNGF